MMKMKWFRYAVMALAILCTSAAMSGRSNSKLNEDLAGSLRGGMPQTYTWIYYPDCYCVPDPSCQTDGCGGAWPIADCPSHKAVRKVQSAADEWCTADWPSSLWWNCEHTLEWATCSTVEGNCVIYTQQQDPLIQTCSQTPATGTNLAPQVCAAYP